MAPKGAWAGMPGGGVRCNVSAAVSAAAVRERLRSLVGRATAPSLALGVAVAVSVIVAETLLMCLVNRVTGENHVGALYLLGVFVVATVWGPGLAAATSLASAVAFDCFRDWPAAHFNPVGDGLVITTFLIVALSTNFVAGVARARAVEANQRHHEAGALAEQQAALRRVATLAARGVDPAEVFTAVAEEMTRCLDVVDAEVLRYDRNDAAIILASHNDFGWPKLHVGERMPLEGDNVAARVLRTARTARMDNYANATGPIAARVHGLGMRSVAGAPIMVDGRVWGALLVGWRRRDPLPANIEKRVGDFADLIATTLAAAATRAELTASRARIVAAADEARRRLERDLHDGAQQRLASVGLALRRAQASVPPELHSVQQQLSEIVSSLTAASSELQEISRGIHPAILSKGGLCPALKALAGRSSVPVTLDLGVHRRLPEAVAVGAYYVVAEALTNTAKHARASEVTVHADADDKHLRLLIRDDGIGGADPGKGSGLVGLTDRIEALGGHLRIVSPPATGTALHITIPLHQRTCA